MAIDILEVKMSLIENEIDKLISEKNLIDIRLNELYENMDDLIVEWKNKNQVMKNDYDYL